MAIPMQDTVSADQFKLMTEVAGLGLTPQELEELKPIYDLYWEYVKLLHSIDFGAEEIGLTFHPDWPSA